MDRKRRFFSKLPQNPRLYSQRHARRCFPEASGQRGYPDSSLFCLNRDRKTFVNTGSFSTLTTLLTSSAHQWTPQHDPGVREPDTSCDISHSGTDCGSISKNLTIQCASSTRATNSTPVGHSHTSTCNTAVQNYLLADQQRLTLEKTALEACTMGSLFKNDGTATITTHAADVMTTDSKLMQEGGGRLDVCSARRTSPTLTSREFINTEHVLHDHLSKESDIPETIAVQSEGHIGISHHTQRQESRTSMFWSNPVKPSPQFGRQISKRTSDAHEAVPPLPRQEDENEDDESSDDDDDFHSVGSSHGQRSDPCTPTSPKTRRVDIYDPYQIFEVQHSPCLILTVRVIQGRNITLGFQDYYDTPDPYVNLVLKSSPEGRRSTTVKENDPNPVWNETFTFFISFSQANVMEISLMESNSLWFDQTVGTVYFNILNIYEMDKPQLETFVFNDVSQVDIEFKLEFDRNPTLRYSLCLCSQEKKFMEQRKEKVLEAMRKLLGDEDGPQNVDEVPTIAVIGSGGGFRAMTGYSGVFKALVESGVLGCTMYACGLSGSSWLLSTLYSHPKWPNLDMNEFLDELKNSIDKSLLRFFNASTMYSYVKFMVEKRREGQPVSFTDIFGRMVGETLLTGRMETTLTDQREKIKDCAVPMPLYTCVHVKKDVPARSFQEWVEFSPFEIGMPKYGTFMDAELFGSKFFMGKLVKQYKEQPLHFLQGIWGSAFCILFKRLLEDNHRIDPVEMVRQEMGDKLDEAGQESSSDCSDDEMDDFSMDSTDSVDSEAVLVQSVEDVTQNTTNDEKMLIHNPWNESTEFKTELNDTNDVDELSSRTASEIATQHNSNFLNDNTSKTITRGCCVDDGSSFDGDEEEDDIDDEKEIVTNKFKERGSVEMNKAYEIQQLSKNCRSCGSDFTEGQSERFQLFASSTSSDSQQFENRLDQVCDHKKSVNWGTCPTFGEKKETKQKRHARISGTSMRKSRSHSKSYWKQLLKGIFESNSWELLSTRRGRAAVIHNFMRGLSLQQSYPLSPFTPVEERVTAGDEFDGIFEMHPTSVKHIYMVDAGLAYNSPYPLILRPQREVDIILSFDFSARPSDNDLPFKELLLAEKWAKLNRLPFPPIDTSVFDRDGMKELYIFRHPTDPYCPVVFHFVLINKKFKYYKKPEIARETKEEFDFAEFDVFDDPRAPYSTFNFTFTHNDFERLSQLMEFNTLLHIGDIKEVIREVIKKKREAPPRKLIQSRDITLLHMKSRKEACKLQHFISRMESRSSFHFGRSPSTPFYTPTPNGEISRNPFFSGFHRKLSRSSSVDNIINSKKDGLSENVYKSIYHRPIDNFSKTRQLKYIASTKKDFSKKAYISANSPSVENMYTSPRDSADYFHHPGDSADYFHHPEQTAMFNETNSGMNQQYETDSGYEQKSDHTNICTESFYTIPEKTTAVSPEMAVDLTLFHNTKKPMLSPKLKLPGTSEFTPHETVDNSSISSGFGSLSTDANNSWDVANDYNSKIGSSGKLTPGTGVFSTESTGSWSLGSDSSDEKLKPTRRMKKDPPPNPFFAKAYFNTSSHNSSSANSTMSSLAGSDTGDSCINGISDQLNPEMFQSINSAENQEDTYIIGSVNSLSSQPSPLILSSPSKPSLIETQPSPSHATPEIFSLAPEAFKADGTPVFNSEKAKMYYDSVKEKRKIFRRQSTVSSLKNISLDECESLQDEVCDKDQCSSVGSKNIQFSSNRNNMADSSDTQFTEFSRTSYKDMEQEMDTKEMSNTVTAKSEYEVDFEILDLSQFKGVTGVDDQQSGESVS